MVQKIDAASVEVLFGGKRGLDKEIAAYKLSLKAHAKSIGRPAPTTHPFVELIVKKHDGKYELVGPDLQQETPAVPLTLFQTQQQANAALADRRYARQMKGIVYKGHEFSANPASLVALLAAIAASEDDTGPLTWKDRLGKFVELHRSDMVEILKQCRAVTQEAFNNEQRLRARIENAKTKESVLSVDLEKGWPE